LSAAQRIDAELSTSRVEHAEVGPVLEIASRMLAWVRTIRAILILGALFILVLAGIIILSPAA
jgi:hypothetical protein